MNLTEKQKQKAESIFKQLMDIATIEEIKNGVITVEHKFEDGEPADIENKNEFIKSAEMKLHGRAKW